MPTTVNYSRITDTFAETLSAKWILAQSAARLAGVAHLVQLDQEWAGQPAVVHVVDTRRKRHRRGGERVQVGVEEHRVGGEAERPSGVARPRRCRERRHDEGAAGWRGVGASTRKRRGRKAPKLARKCVV